MSTSNGRNGGTLTPFPPGVSGNKGGRGLGVRNKLSRKFVYALHKSWEDHGADAIKRVIAEKPDQYLKIIASLLPKEVQIDAGGNLADVLHDLGLAIRAQREAARIINLQAEHTNGGTPADQLPAPRPMHSLPGQG